MVGGGAILAAITFQDVFGLMLYVFHLTAVMEDFEGMGKAMLAVLLVLANVTFVIYDVLIARLEIYYHVRLRPKLHL